MSFLPGRGVREETRNRIRQLMDDFPDWLCDHHGCRIPIFPEHQSVFLKPAPILDEIAEDAGKTGEERVREMIRRTCEDACIK